LLWHDTRAGKVVSFGDCARQINSELIWFRLAGSPSECCQEF
jgi:hypothetical protein